MNDSKLNPAKKVLALRDMAKQFGLQPRPPAKPLPHVDIEDVQLVTWMAVVPAENGGGE
jgi:hypothetical protein